MKTLRRHNFVEYFSAKAGFTGSIEDRIQPPKDATEIFIGGGIIGSDIVKMGVFGNVEELFDQRKYPRDQDTEAKSVRKYHAYYDSGSGQPIGFSKTPTIRLKATDVSNPDDETKLCACASSGYLSLWRCGTSTSSNQTDFGNTFQIVFYYRT